MEFTGERFLPELDIDSEIAVFHYQRYKSIVDICRGKIVLDAACGEGYGSRMLSDTAEKVYGIDIDEKTIQVASQKYKRDNLKFKQGSVGGLQFADDSFDIVISYETIEHVNADLQKQFINEIYRVLKPEGILVMSSPDKLNYSDIPNFTNKFHVNELYFDEFERLLKSRFDNIDFYYQGRVCNSYIFEPGKSVAEISNEVRLREADQTQAEYIIAVCSNRKITERIENVICDVDNKYYKMKRKIIELKKIIGNPIDIIEQKENYINEQREMLEQRDNEIREINGVIEQKENYIDEQRKMLEQRDVKIRETNGIIEQKENYINEQRRMLEQRDIEIREINGILEQKENYINEQRRILEQKESCIVSQQEMINVMEGFVLKKVIRKLYAVYLKKFGGN